jgi:hypothetical protein
VFKRFYSKKGKCMMTYDPDLAEIIRNEQPVEIAGKDYIVVPNRSGSCEGCAFGDLTKCPNIAVKYCCSNGGNVLKEA